MVRAKQVMQRYGIVESTLWRWLHDPDLEFPPPIYIRRQRLWKLADLDEFDRRQMATAA